MNLRYTVPSCLVVLAANACVQEGDPALADRALPTANLVLAPADDAFVRENHPTTNYGDDDKLDAKRGADDRHSLMRFRRPPLVDATCEASLSVYMFDGNDEGETWSLYELPGAHFSEDDVTWANRPLAGAPLEEVTTTTEAQFVTFDVTEWVRDAGTEFVGFTVKHLEDGKSISMRSKEYGGNAIPKLTVSGGPSGCKVRERTCAAQSEPNVFGDTWEGFAHLPACMSQCENSPALCNDVCRGHVVDACQPAAEECCGGYAKYYEEGTGRCESTASTSTCWCDCSTEAGEYNHAVRLQQ
ncbi:MAG: DNRLRE domain-containing protein [Myxococcota bacterium]